MPIKELLIKKVYTNVYNKYSTAFKVSKGTMNFTLRKKYNNFIEFIESILALIVKEKNNEEKLHLFTIMTQTLPNASYDVILIKNDNDIMNKYELLCELYRKKNVQILMIKIDDAFGGVWSLL